MTEKMIRPQTIDLPTEGWEPIDDAAIQAIILRLHADDPSVKRPPECYGWKAPGNEDAGFILLQVPGFCPRLYLDNYKFSQLVPLPHSAAHAALSHALGEDPDDDDDAPTKVSQTLYAVPETGWRVADPELVRGIVLRLGHTIPAMVDLWQAPIADVPGSYLLIISAPGVPPYGLLSTPQFMVQLPPDAALQAEGFAKADLARGGGDQQAWSRRRDLRGRRSING